MKIEFKKNQEYLASRFDFIAQSLEILVAFASVFGATYLSEFFFNWDPLHARLNSLYEAWSYKERRTKRLKHTRNLFRKNLQLKDVYQF